MTKQTITVETAEQSIDTHNGPRMGVAATAGFILLVIAMPAWIYWQTSTSTADQQPTWPLFIIVQLAAWRLVWILLQENKRIHEMIFWMFVYIFMGLAPLAQFRLGVEPFTTTNLSDLYYGEAILIVLIGCVALYTGGSWADRRPYVVRLRDAQVINQHRAQILFVLSLGAAIYYTHSIGFEVLFESREARANAVETTWPSRPVSELLGVGTSLGLLMAYIAQRQALVRSDDHKRFLAISILVANIIVLFIFVNPVSSSRYLFGTVFLAVLAAHGAFSTQRLFRIVTLLAVPGFVVLFPLADYFRDAATENGVELNIIESMLSGDYDSFAQVINAAEYANTEGITWGIQLLGALLLWIPRGLWATKPQPTGAILADFKEYDFHNLSAPIWAEFYVDGAWFLVITGMFVLGFGLRRLDQNFDQVLSYQKIPGLTGCILPFFMVILLRGTLMGVASGLFVVLLAKVFVTKRGQSSQ